MGPIFTVCPVANLLLALLKNCTPIGTLTLLFDFCMFLEIWLEKSGSRKVVLQTLIFFLVREKWLTAEKQLDLYYKSTVFQV